MGLRVPFSFSLASLKRFIPIVIVTFGLTFIFHFFATTPAVNKPHPKIVLISLDGATPPLLDRYFATGVLDKRKGLGLLQSQGLVAKQNQFRQTYAAESPTPLKRGYLFPPFLRRARGISLVAVKK